MKAEETDQLLGIEGNAARIYFANFTVLLKAENVLGRPLRSSSLGEIGDLHGEARRYAGFENALTARCACRRARARR
jgi:hypothetical protein